MSNVIRMKNATEMVGTKVRNLYDQLPRRTEVLWADVPARAELLRLLDSLPADQRQAACDATGEGERLMALYEMERGLDEVV